MKSLTTALLTLCLSSVGTLAYGMDEMMQKDSMHMEGMSQEVMHKDAPMKHDAMTPAKPMQGDMSMHKDGMDGGKPMEQGAMHKDKKKM